jgi:hypothetical protein
VAIPSTDMRLGFTTQICGRYGGTSVCLMSSSAGRHLVQTDDQIYLSGMRAALRFLLSMVCPSRASDSKQNRALWL